MEGLKKTIESLTAVKPTLDPLPPIWDHLRGEGARLFIERVVKYGMKQIL